MRHSLSLSQDVRARAFLAANGELGILPVDVRSFLDACRADGVGVLGWELWIIDHTWGAGHTPVAAPGSWCGGIPVRDAVVSAGGGGEGDADETERQLAAFAFAVEIEPDWLPHLRVNVTLA